MGKARRNKGKEPVTDDIQTGHAVVTDEVSEMGATSEHQVDAKIEILTDRFNDLLGNVKNMLIQLEEISYGMKSLLNNRQKIDAHGKSIPASSDMVVECGRDIIAEFHNLKQTGTVTEYQEKFVELRDFLMTVNYGLTEDYFISSFLSGLKEEIRCSIRKPKPETLIHAFNLARIQELTIEVMKENSNSAGETLPLDCVNVFVGHENPNMFTSAVGERVVTVIISTGIPYSFIDTAVAIQTGCDIEETEPLLVNFVIGGYRAVSRFRCPWFRWTVQGHEFAQDVRVVEIRACDLVLGGDWVTKNCTLGFSADGIVLYKGGKELVLLNKRGLAKSKDHQEDLSEVE